MPASFSLPHCSALLAWLVLALAGCHQVPGKSCGLGTSCQGSFPAGTSWKKPFSGLRGAGLKPPPADKLAGGCFSTARVWGWKDKYEVKKFARQCLKEYRRMQQGVPLPDDFEDGFVQAFVDISQGGSGAVPGVPPKSYWGPSTRSPAGHAAAQAWFAGYAVGAEQALASGVAAFNYIPASMPLAADPVPFAGADTVAGRVQPQLPSAHGHH